MEVKCNIRKLGETLNQIRTMDINLEPCKIDMCRLVAEDVLGHPEKDPATRETVIVFPDFKRMFGIDVNLTGGNSESCTICLREKGAVAAPQKASKKK